MTGQNGLTIWFSLNVTLKGQLQQHHLLPRKILRPINSFLYKKGKKGIAVCSSLPVDCKWPYKTLGRKYAHHQSLNQWFPTMDAILSNKQEKDLRWA